MTFGISRLACGSSLSSLTPGSAREEPLLAGAVVEERGAILVKPVVGRRRERDVKRYFCARVTAT